MFQIIERQKQRENPAVYECELCGARFGAPLYCEERHGLPGAWSEITQNCPRCRAAGMIREVARHAG